MKNPLIKWLIIAVLLVLILCFSTCYTYLELNKANNEKEGLQGELLGTRQRFLELVKKDSTREYTQNQLISSERNARILAEDKAKGMRDIKVVTKFTAEIIHDTLFIPFTSESLDTTMRPNTAFFGHRDFEHKNKYDTIAGRVDSLGVTITKNVTNVGEVTTIIANEKYGFLNLKSKPVVKISFENPNVRITSMSNVVVETKKPKRLAWFGAGLVTGFIGGLFIK